jgi:hypothetical protein
VKKFLISFLGTAIFIIVLLVVYAAHMRWLRVDVVFYASLLDVFIAVAIAALALCLFRPFDALTRFERFQLIVIWLLGGYAFAISLPTVIDRSLSFYLLEKLDQRGGGIKQSAFEEVFVTEYVKEHRLADVRLTEQLESGTITISDGCVSLTNKGRRIVAFSRFFRTAFLPRKRLLMGKYTDALTDPFRGEDEGRAPTPSYVCSPLSAR